MKIFLYDGVYSRKEESHMLLKYVGKMYTGQECEIDSIKGGKPIMSAVDVEYSISHTGSIWGCAMQDKVYGKIGFDLQYYSAKYSNYIEIAKRFFTEDEVKYVKDKGKDGFFEVWTKKEAYGKYDETGIFKGNLKKFSVLNPPKDICFKEIDMQEYMEKFSLYEDCENHQGKIYGSICGEENKIDFNNIEVIKFKHNG